MATVVVTSRIARSPSALHGRISKFTLKRSASCISGSSFADDPERGKRMTAEAAGIYLDYSKNRVTDETIKLLLQLAEESGLRPRIDAMFRGDKINTHRKSGGAACRAARAARDINRR